MPYLTDILPLASLRAGRPFLAIAGSLALAGCVSTGGQQAKLPNLPQSDGKPKTETANAAPIPARMPGERYSGPLVAATSQGEPVAAMETPVALDTPPPAEVASLGQQQEPQTFNDMVMEPTATSAGNGSIFANHQTAYAPTETRVGSAASSSLVPSDLPTRSGINASVSSLFSAPKPAPAYPAYTETAMEAQPAGGGEELIAPEPAPVGYDPAEPVAATEAVATPDTTGKKKSFSLMRMLGRKGS